MKSIGWSTCSRLTLAEPRQVGQFRIRLRVRSKQHDNFSNTLHNSGITSIGQPGTERIAIFSCKRIDPYLDEFMIRQRSIGFPDQSLAHTLIADAHHRVQVMGDLAQPAPGFSIEAGPGVLR